MSKQKKPKTKTIAKDILIVLKKEFEKSAGVIAKKVSKELKKRKYICLKDYLTEQISSEISSAIKKGLPQLKIDLQKLELKIPPSHIAGDIALIPSEFIKETKEKLDETVKQISKAINEQNLSLIKKAEPAGPFVNLTLKKGFLYAKLLSAVTKLEDKYGESDINAKKIALVEYSSPNIAKPIGVGHLRSTIIGEALANLYQKTGYTIIRENYLGDWGTQFGTLIYAYQNWAEENEIKKNPLKALKDLYVRFHEEAQKNPKLNEKARFIFKRLEEKDPEIVRLWKKFSDLSLAEFKKTYQKLGVKFDRFSGESFFADESDSVIKECLRKGLARQEKNSKIIIIDSLKNLPSFLIRKSDGSTLYHTRDLASMRFRVEKFKPAIIVYVVGKEQELYFKQLFALAKKMDYAPETELKHIWFGLVLRQGKKMSTRKGSLIELDELIKEAVAKSKNILKEKNPNLTPKELEEISEIIGIGAIVYNDLKQSRIKNISFDWDKMLDFEGGSAVYLQYTYVRINSILRKIGKEIFSAPEKPVASELAKKMTVASELALTFQKESEWQLAKKLMFFPVVILKAESSNSPHLVATYLEELAQSFNNFYNEISVIKTKDKILRESRIVLIQSVAQVIKNGLKILNIKVPPKM